MYVRYTTKAKSKRDAAGVKKRQADGWLERTPDEREVESSSLSRPTTYQPRRPQAFAPDFSGQARSVRFGRRECTQTYMTKAKAQRAAARTNEGFAQDFSGQARSARFGRRECTQAYMTKAKAQRAAAWTEKDKQTGL